MTIQNILLNFHCGSTFPLVSFLFILLFVGLTYCLVRGYIYLMRKYGKQVAAFFLSVALFSAVVADKPDAGSTNAPPDGVSGTNTVEQTGTEGTNDTGGVVGPLMMGLFGRSNLGQMFETITDEDIAQGWRLTSVSSNVLPASTFTMPSHATVWEDARDFGAGWGSWKIPFDGWRFSFGDEGMTNAFVWVEGYFRSRFNSRTNEVTLLSERMALCPAANWSRYNLPASRAWSATNGVGGLVTTFENAAVGDDPTKIVSAQMELSPQDGKVSLRYDLRSVGESLYEAGVTANGTNHFVTVGSNTSEVVFQRVHPDDWDFDGLPNALDPSPRQPDASAGFNQSDAWAMLAFPSNAAEIASMGYAAWAAARAADPNRRLVGLRISSPTGIWPVCLSFGDIQVMCDGSGDVVFALDCGAHYPFSLSDGAELSFFTLYGETDDVEPCAASDYPYERWANDVVTHLESPRTGWIGRTAEATVDGLDGTHFFPNDSRTVMAVVTNCHEDAYIDCTWSGGDGITFSNPHALTTTVTWHSTNTVAWATNCVDLVTTYEGGYAITNHNWITVGPQMEPTTEFSVGCQKVFFLNDADFLAPGNFPTNRPERIRPVTLRLVAPCGTGGYVSIENDGAAQAVLFQVENGVTNRIDASTRIRLEVAEGTFTRECVKTVYMSCPVLGRGTLFATWAPDEDAGEGFSAEVDYQVIEPVRKQVWTQSGGNVGFPLVANPSRLVYGTNAVLCVGVNVAQGDEFVLTNVQWTVSGAAEKVSTIVTNSLAYCVVSAVGDSGEAVVEARFNGDEVQPRFVLPVVRPRVIPVRIFTVSPPDDKMTESWSEDEIAVLIPMVNFVYSQVGIRFELQGEVTPIPDSGQYWELNSEEYVWQWNWGLVPFHRVLATTQQTISLMSHYTEGDCVEIYLVGKIFSEKRPFMAAFRTPDGIVVSKGIDAKNLAHELGHALGLRDCYDFVPPPNAEVDMFSSNSPVVRSFFSSSLDWGNESGRGFYESVDTHSSVMRRLLMYGRTAIITELSGFDIPDGEFEGLSKDGQRPDDITCIRVGARSIEPINGKVYSR